MCAKPNIVLVNCDDLGYGDLGCYGSEVNRTPNLDKMATEGMRFTDFYMGSPVCSPSRGAMMTGCYPPRISFGSFDGRWVLFPGDGIGLNPKENTIASLLKRQGYATMCVGKWHCGDQKEFLPTRHGFDHYYGLPYSNDMGRQAGRVPGWAKGPNGVPPLPLVADEEVIQAQPDQSSLTERYVEKCVQFMRDNREKPFFLYFAHMYVHLPIYVPDRFMRTSRNGRYGAAVECVDWSVGVILDELKRLGLEQDTLVVFTSDNGSRCRDEGGSNAPLRGTKGTTWEGGQRLPCIMRWPAAIPAGRVCREIAASIDFLPTFVHLAGGEVPEQPVIDGMDLSSLLFGGEQSPREEFFFCHQNRIEAVRKGEWKLHLLKGQEERLWLYNLVLDPGEQNEVAAEHPEIVAELRDMVDAARKVLGEESQGIEGSGCRPAGRVENPVPLTEYDENHPYIEALYDLGDRG